MFLQDQGRNKLQGEIPECFGWQPVPLGKHRVTGSPPHPVPIPRNMLPPALHLQRAVLVLIGADGHVIGQVRETFFLRIIS